MLFESPRTFQPFAVLVCRWIAYVPGRFSVEFCQLGFWVERVHMRRRPVHEEKDHALRARSEVGRSCRLRPRRPRAGDVARLCDSLVVREKTSERHRADAHTALAEKVAARDKVVRRRDRGGVHVSFRKRVLLSLDGRRDLAGKSNGAGERRSCMIAHDATAARDARSVADSFGCFLHQVLSPRS